MTSVLSDVSIWVASGAALKATLLLAAAWLAINVLRPGSAATRHLIWAAAVLGALSLPLAGRLTPAWRSGLVEQAASRWLVEPSKSVVEQAISLSPFVISSDASASPWLEAVTLGLWLIWLAGSSVFLFVLIAGLTRLAWIGMRAELISDPRWIGLETELSQALGIRRPIRLLRSPHAVMPVTWGYFCPRVLLPADSGTWPETRIRVVLAHELAHIKRRDWSVQILAEIARIVYWFNPLIWISCNRLRAESELAADDAVLRLGIRPLSYAGQLLEMARSLTRSGQAWLPALAVARQSNLERRLVAMLNPSLDRSSVNTKTAVLTIAAVLCLVLPLAAWQTLTGKFFGTVYDSSGGVVPNATVIASNPEARTRDMTTTGAGGGFEFQNLPSGRYMLEVMRPGFATFRMANLFLEPNKTHHQTVTLQLGRVSERIDVVAQSPARAAAAPTAEAGPSQIRVGGNVQATKMVHMVRPVYPPVAKAAGIQGAVLLEAVISKEGSILSLRVANSQIDPDLARAAVEAVSQWRYQPTWLNGQPVEVIVDITVNFALQK